MVTNATRHWPGLAALQVAHPVPTNTPVDLVFCTQTDWTFPSDFTLDQVKLLTHCLSA